jgi:spheroidene monooxygenase
VAAGPVTVVLLGDIEARHRLWGWSRFVITRSRLRRTPGLRFGKFLGSGHEGGFGLQPSASVQGLFCVFDDAQSAQAFVAADGPAQAWRERSREWFCCQLRAYSSRGSWSGRSLPASAEPPSEGPVASLTRASIRLAKARDFWRMQPPAERSLAQASGVILAAGVGEAPVFRQATFTLWDSVASMDAYSRSGAHSGAIAAAYAGDFFSESMFVRFVIDAAQGSWKGRRFA